MSPQPPLAVAEARRTLREPRLAGHRALSLTVDTHTAYQLPLAAILCGALLERGALGTVQAESVETALHEAVTNAVLHGNLGIGSEDRGTPQDFERFSHCIAEQLEDPALAARPVGVAAGWRPGLLAISVTDAGDGFAPASLAMPGAACHGRGLPLMRLLASRISWHQGRRRLLLVFRTAADPAP